MEIDQKSSTSVAPLATVETEAEDDASTFDNASSARYSRTQAPRASFLQLRHRADEILEKLGVTRAGRVTRKGAVTAPKMKSCSEDDDEHFGNPETSKPLSIPSRSDYIRKRGGESLFNLHGEKNPTLVDELMKDTSLKLARDERRSNLLERLGLKGKGADEDTVTATTAPTSTGLSSAGVSKSVRQRLKEKFECQDDQSDDDCFKPLQSTLVDNVVRTNVASAATADLRTLMSLPSAKPGATGNLTGTDVDVFRNVFYLMPCFPRFVEEYNFLMQTLFNCPKLPSRVFYQALEKMGLEDRLQYFRMTDSERTAIWEGWTEEGPRKPRRRAEIDFFKLVTDPSVKDGDILKMPHPENRVVLRGANLIVDSRNTEHHFFARVISRGSGKNKIVNNIVFNKVTKRVEMDSDVHKAHLPVKKEKVTEICDDEYPPESEEDPFAMFRCNDGSGGYKRCNY